jgi:hypothetical protein
MKLQALITATLVGYTSIIHGADSFNTEVMATQISNNVVLLRHLAEFSSDPVTANLGGNSVMVHSVLATLTPSELRKMSSLISAELGKNTPAASSGPMVVYQDLAPSNHSPSSPLTDIAKIIASDSDYLAALLNICNAQASAMDYLGKPDKVQAVLATLSIMQLELLATTLTNPKEKTAVNAAIQELKKTSSSASQPSAASAIPNTNALLKGRKQYDLEGHKVARFKTAALGDCGLLSLPVNVTRDEARKLIEHYLAENRFDTTDADYLRTQHYFLQNIGESLAHKHLKLIGFALGFNVRFFIDFDGVLIEDTDAQIKSAKRGLTDVYILDLSARGFGHFEPLVPTTHTAALIKAFRTENEKAAAEAAFQRKHR